MIGMRDVLAGVRPRRADQNALAVARAAQHLVIDLHVIASGDERFFRAVFDQVRVAVHDAQHFDVVAQKRHGRRRNHGIGGGRRTAGE